MTRFLSILLLTFLLAPLALAGSPPASNHEIGKFLQQDELKTYRQLQAYGDIKLAASDFQDFPQSADLLNTTYRSPNRAFLYSVIVPGTGQLYNDSKIKAGIFMGIEVAAWSIWYVNHNNGQKKTDAYNVFADKNWSPTQYTDWLIETYGIASDTAAFIDPGTGDPTHFTHHLPTTKTQQYYEMIGKYDQFQYGWLDTDYLTGKSSSPLRRQYLNDRATANDYFTKAKSAAIISIANHLLSAFDAALSAKRYNKKQDTFSQLSLKARFVRYENEQIPKLTLTYQF